MPPMSAASAEMEYYAANCRILEGCGMEVERGKMKFFNNIPVQVGPCVVFDSNFMPACYKVADRVKGGCITARCASGVPAPSFTCHGPCALLPVPVPWVPRSTLIVEGDVVLEDLDLDGALWIKVLEQGFDT